MITLNSPHMGINDLRAPAFVQMFRTIDVTCDASPGSVIQTVVRIAAETPTRKFTDVVFSCHGNSGSLQVGTGFDRSSTQLFTAWAGLVKKIWLRGCMVALTSPNGDGYAFCSEIARAARCHVVASTELQVTHTRRRLPYGQLDTFEGLVLSFGPAGNITWSRRYPSTYIIDGSDGTMCREGYTHNE